MFRSFHADTNLCGIIQFQKSIVKLRYTRLIVCKAEDYSGVNRIPILREITRSAFIIVKISFHFSKLCKLIATEDIDITT